MKKCCFNLRIQDALKSVFDRYSAILRGGAAKKKVNTCQLCTKIDFIYLAQYIVHNTYMLVTILLNACIGYLSDKE